MTRSLSDFSTPSDPTSEPFDRFIPQAPRLQAISRKSPLTKESRSAAKERSLHLACRCAQAAEDARGQDTLVLDLTDVTPIVDYFVITTGTSSRQMKSLAAEVDRVLRREGSRPQGVEGEAGASWILHDFGDIVLHVFTSEARRLYDLEHLWADAPRVDWKAVNGRSPH